MVNYQNGKIYQIVNDVNSKIYIGSTCQSLSKRMHTHRACGKGLIHDTPIYLAMHEIGIDHFRIILVKNAPCHSKEELHANEYDIMRSYQQQGVILYNATIAGVVSRETRAKLSTRGAGRVATAEARANMSKAQRKRGCVAYNRMREYWGFQTHKNGKNIVKYFSVKKFGYNAAHGLALFNQEEMYPIEREDDSEFIQEIKNRLNK